MSSQKWALTLTWENQISHNNKLSLLGIADPGEVGVQHDEEDTGQEGQDADSDSIAAGAVVLVENARGLFLGLWVNVAFSCDSCKHHNGEQLQRWDTQS